MARDWHGEFRIAQETRPILKLLHVYSGNLYGGVETLLGTLAKCADLCPAMTTEFALCFHGRLAHELSATGLPVHDLGPVSVRRPLSIWRARQKLAQLLRDRQYDLVICHSLWPQALFGPVVQHAKLPLVLWIHDVMSGWHWIDRWASLTRPDLVICNSQFTKTTLRNVYRKVKSSVIYYPIAQVTHAHSGHDRAMVRSQLSTPMSAVVIIQVSRMQAWKGQLLHLNALADLKDIPGWVCWQVGGAQRPNERRYVEVLQSRAEALGIADRVRFLGQRQDVQKLLFAADIFCQPNIGPEPFGISFAEALATCLPVVTTNMGGAKEVVDESCGFLVDNNVAAVADSLRKLIESSALRAELGSKGPEKMERLCSSKNQLEQLFDSFRNCVDQSLNTTSVNTPES